MEREAAHESIKILTTVLSDTVRLAEEARIELMNADKEIGIWKATLRSHHEAGEEDIIEYDESWSEAETFYSNDNGMC